MLALIALQTLTSPAHAHDDPLQGTPRGFGLGVVLGEPTGISLALRPNVHNAIQGHASWSFLRDRFRFNIDYLQTIGVAEADSFEVPFYVGIGGLAAIDDDDDQGYLGGRIPLGFAIHPRDVPLEPFLEVAPGVLVFPETDVIVEGALGLRYYF